MPLPTWGDRTRVMAVLNLTPDSFSDGGRLRSCDLGRRAAARALAAGADILDLGGQSTRPGAPEVGAREECRRVIPLLEAVRAEHPGAVLSVDTFQPAVAESALAAGADWINDVSGGRRDPAMLRIVAASGCGYVLMHSRGDSRSMDRLARYGDVVADVLRELHHATDRALAAGLQADRIIWDPGLGFAKTTAHNLALLQGLSRLRLAGFPLLVGPSRKRFIGAVVGESRPRARIWGTAATVCRAIAAGADVIRVHDVRPMVQTARMADALWRCGDASPASAAAAGEA
jgi:dihydropteroate synthase